MSENGGINMIKISDAEYEVMKVIWKRKEVTSLEIIEELKDSKWNFNTIRTLIKRLQTKGAIKVSGRRGKTFSYISKIDESEYKIEMAKDLLKKVYNNSLEDFILDYCKASKITADDLREIIKDIDKKQES